MKKITPIICEVVASIAASVLSVFSSDFSDININVSSKDIMGDLEKMT